MVVDQTPIEFDRCSRKIFQIRANNQLTQVSDSVAKPAEPASGAPATDFAAPPVTTGQEASTTTPADSPFQIDTGADPAVQAFQADPASIEKESAGDEPAPTDRVDSLLKQFRERYGKQ